MGAHLPQDQLQNLCTVVTHDCLGEVGFWCFFKIQESFAGVGG